jgi:hypothetical protein
MLATAMKAAIGTTELFSTIRRSTTLPTSQSQTSITSLS